MAALTLSAIVHATAAAALGLAIAWGGFTAQKVYVVNLVPSIAAVGSPTAPPPPAPLPPRPATPAPVKPTAPVLPEPREARVPDPPKAPPSLPEAALPSTRMPPRPAALPRAGEKELPPLAPPTEARPTPPPPPGTVTGSTSGTGVRTLDVTDFPHAWYLRQVLSKVEAAWQRQGQIAEPPQKPLVIVEIQRDGSIAVPRIEKSSGNAFYDQAALRAIMEAKPFPPLPKDWTRPTLGVMFSFDLERGRG